jgi:1-acyl-sn-glycerol-3-phosphate acyltransferase
VPGRPAERSYRVLAAILRPILGVLVHREGRGAEHLPDGGGFVVCSNHLSYLDPFTLADYLLEYGHPGYFLAKESVFRIPVFGWVVRRSGQIPVRRYSAAASGALVAAVEAVREGRCVVVYPEGTLTRDPDLWPMSGRTGAARLALTTGCPVVPVAQWGPQQVLPPYRHWPRLLPRATTWVVAGPPVPLDDLRQRPMDAEVLAKATDRVLDAVTALLVDLRGRPAPSRRLERWDPDGSNGSGDPSGRNGPDGPTGSSGSDGLDGSGGSPTDDPGHGPEHREAS